MRCERCQTTTRRCVGKGLGVVFGEKNALRCSEVINGGIEMRAWLGIVVLGLVCALPSPGRAAIKVVKADYAAPPCKLGKDRCPEISLKRIQSDDPWISATMDKIMYPPCWSDMEDTGKTNCSLQQDVNDFAAQSAESVQMQTPPYSYNVEPEILKDWGRLKQFAVASHTYTGGAHGNPNYQFVVLDPKARKIISLSDVIASGQMAKLTAMVRERNRQRVVASEGASELADYLESFPFEMSENFVFDRTGLTIQYNVYEIAPYAAGPITYTIPYTQLKGVLKTDYYPPASYLNSLKK